MVVLLRMVRASVGRGYAFVNERIDRITRWIVARWTAAYLLDSGVWLSR
jgi:hypothetical protein